MRIDQIALMKTSDLVKWYNEHAPSPVTKFTNRATAERRCAQLAAVLGDKPAPVLDLEDMESVRMPEPEHKRYISKTKRSEAQAQCWRNKEVATARSARHHVLVNGHEFSSVREAFAELGLPMTKHIPFRGRLKKDKTLVEFGYTWELVEGGE